MADPIALFYAAGGIALSAGGGAIAYLRARTQRRSHYADTVYHMTRRTHRQFCALSIGFSLAFAAGLRWPAIVIPLLAVYTLLLVLYASSFARGFSGEDD